MSAFPLRIEHGSPPHWVIRALWAAGTIAFVLYIPTKTETSTILDMTLAFQLAVAALSLNLVMGYGGIVSLGHSAFFGLGGYTSALIAGVKTGFGSRSDSLNPLGSSSPARVLAC